MLADALPLHRQRFSLRRQHRQHRSGETDRAVAGSFAAGGIGFLRRNALFGSELRHRLEAFKQRRLVFIVVRQHAGPQINPNGVVAADVWLDGVRLPTGADPPHHPIRREAVRRGVQPQSLIDLAHRTPWAVQRRKTRQQLRRQVAGIQPPAIFRHEPDFARQQHQAQAGNVGHFLAADALQQQRSQGLITPAFPQAAGFEQVVSNPQVGVRRRVGVQHLPLLIVALSPQPGGQAGAEIARRQIVLRPGQQQVEGRPVVGHQGEKQAVTLSLGGGDFVRAAWVDHPPLRADVELLVLLPTRPLAGRGGAEGAQQQHAERQALQHRVHRRQSRSSGARRRRLKAFRPRHSISPRITTSTTAITASSTGWVERAYHSRSHHGRWPT